MFIVDYSNDYYGNKTETLVFNTDLQVIDFAADKSSSENFKIHRINKYKDGALQPYELGLKSGRIVLAQQAAEIQK